MKEDNSNINPFFEEFDEKDVVNRPKPFEEFIDSEPANEENIGSKVMADIVSDGENLHLRTIEQDEDEFFGVIKKEDIDSGMYSVEEIDTFNSKSKKEETAKDPSQPDLNTKIDFTKENPIIEFKRPEEEIQEYLQKNFKDYIVVPKISGTSKKFSEKNLLHREEVRPTGKKVEIIDNIPETPNPKCKTSILVNRDSQGEIESIEVICKCGERTLITFDYTDITESDQELTEIIDEPKNPIPFDKLHKFKENIPVVNPDLLIEDLKKIGTFDIDDESENEIPSEREEDENEDNNDFNLDEFNDFENQI